MHLITQSVHVLPYSNLAMKSNNGTNRILHNDIAAQTITEFTSVFQYWNRIRHSVELDCWKPTGCGKLFRGYRVHVINRPILGYNIKGVFCHSVPTLHNRSQLDQIRMEADLIRMEPVVVQSEWSSPRQSFIVSYCKLL
jgi:hypothetical protein